MNLIDMVQVAMGIVISYSALYQIVLKEIYNLPSILYENALVKTCK